jgi:hypothetical protein
MIAMDKIRKTKRQMYIKILDLVTWVIYQVVFNDFIY